MTIAQPRVAVDASRVRMAALAVGGALLASAFGAMVTAHPVQAVLLLVLVPLALTAPTATLALILFVTVLVPFDTQNQLSIGGGSGVPGLLAVDLTLGLALCRTAVMLVRGRIPSPKPILVAGVLLTGLLIALAHGLAAGAAPSDAGTEARCAIVGVGAFVLAWPLLQNAQTRTRLLASLLALGFALGLWGVAQVVFNVGYTSGGDIGVRPGIDQVAGVGGGQLQGGLYAYPVAVALAFAALLSPAAKSAALRTLLVAVLGLNLVCVLLTYERSIWAATVIGCLVAAIRSGRSARRAAARWLALGAILLAAYAVVSPGALATTVDRIESSFSYQNQSSFQSRRVESDAVIGQIRRDPLAGAGYGATVTWGQSGQFATKTTNFTHEGYLWLAWKVGVPLALALVGLLLFAALRRTRSTADPPLRAFRVGCHAGLLGSLAVCITFPEFNALGITAVLGILVAGCLVPDTGRGRIDMPDSYRGRIDTAGASTML